MLLALSCSSNSRVSQAEGSSCGRSVDAGTTTPAEGEAGHESLQGTGVGFNGCNLMINNEHWFSRRYKVRGHGAGNRAFDYDTVDPHATS